MQDGWTIEATAERFQVDAKTVRKWRDRFVAEGAVGLQDRSSRPRRSANQTRPATHRRVVALRRRHRWGAARIGHELGLAASTVGRGHAPTVKRSTTGYRFIHTAIDDRTRIVDRLARSREDDVAIALAIKRSGAQLVSATENIDDTPSGKRLHGIMATIAEFYSANLSAEASKGLQQKAKLGGTVPLAPIGYLNVIERYEGAKEIRTVGIDPERAPHVRWAFETFATGDWTICRAGHR